MDIDLQKIQEAYEPVFKRSHISDRMEGTLDRGNKTEYPIPYNTKSEMFDTTELSREALIDRLNTIAASIRDLDKPQYPNLMEEFFKQAKQWGWNKIHKDSEKV